MQHAVVCQSPRAAATLKAAEDGQNGHQLSWCRGRAVVPRGRRTARGPATLSSTPAGRRAARVSEILRLEALECGDCGEGSCGGCGKGDCCGGRDSARRRGPGSVTGEVSGRWSRKEERGEMRER
jgi:hypothetical protein